MAEESRVSAANRKQRALLGIHRSRGGEERHWAFKVKRQPAQFPAEGEDLRRAPSSGPITGANIRGQGRELPRCSCQQGELVLGDSRGARARRDALGRAGASLELSSVQTLTKLCLTWHQVLSSAGDLKVPFHPHFFGEAGEVRLQVTGNFRSAARSCRSLSSALPAPPVCSE